MITAPLAPEQIAIVPYPDERCMYCWYLLHPTEPYPAEWSSTCCAEHRVWMWATYQAAKRGIMKHKQYGKRYEHVDRNGRFTHRKRLQGTACEACSRQLQQTHDYTRYGFMCRACWLAAHGLGEGNDEQSGV